MKIFQSLLTLGLALVITLGVSAAVHAQDDPRAQVVELYNAGQELAGSNEFDEAIDRFREALALAEENDLDDITERITAQLPRIYQSRASAAYRTYQNERTVQSINTAIDYFEDAAEAGEEFGNDEVVQRSRAAVPQLHYIRGVLQYRAENFEDALASVETAIELNPNYATAYYQKAIILKKMTPNDLESILEWYDRAIEVAEQTNDTRTAQNARESVTEELIYRGSNLIQDQRIGPAIEILQRVENYNSRSASAHYRLAEAYNKRGNWDAALEHATRALEYESGGVVDKAKIYFEMGMAYKGNGDKNNACNAFENANYGDFSDPATHELEFELKCEGYASASGR